MRINWDVLGMSTYAKLCTAFLKVCTSASFTKLCLVVGALSEAGSW